MFVIKHREYSFWGSKICISPLQLNFLYLHYVCYRSYLFKTLTCEIEWKSKKSEIIVFFAHHVPFGCNNYSVRRLVSKTCALRISTQTSLLVWYYLNLWRVLFICSFEFLCHLLVIFLYYLVFFKAVCLNFVFL